MMKWCRFWAAWGAFWMVFNFVERDIFWASVHMVLTIGQLYAFDFFRQRSDDANE
jgi:hypothetical protein